MSAGWLPTTDPPGASPTAPENPLSSGTLLMELVSMRLGNVSPLDTPEKAPPPFPASSTVGVRTEVQRNDPRAYQNLP